MVPHESNEGDALCTDWEVKLRCRLTRDQKSTDSFFKINILFIYLFIIYYLFIYYIYLLYLFIIVSIVQLIKN